MVDAARFLTKQGLNSQAIPDLESKKERILKALHASGVPQDELAAVTVLLLLDKTPAEPQGPIVPPVDGTFAPVLRKQIDRTVNLNLAATAMAGAAL